MDFRLLRVYSDQIDSEREPPNAESFVAKFNPDGSELIYSTLLAGGRGTSNHPWALCSDGNGGVIIGGQTNPFENFPVTRGAFDEELNGGDGWVANFNEDVTELRYCTYIGGEISDRVEGLMLHEQGGVVVTGCSESEDFPTTEGVFDPDANGGDDAFVVRLNEDGSELLYSTFIGGNGADRARALCSDGSGGTVITGETTSENFPTTGGSHDQDFNGMCDVFVSRLSPEGDALLYSTFLGGDSLDFAEDICRHGTVGVAITGRTGSENFPTTNNAFDQTYNDGETDAFIATLNVSVVGVPLPIWVEVPEDMIEIFEEDLLQFGVRGVGRDGHELEITFDRGNLPEVASFRDIRDGTGEFRWQTQIGDRGDYQASLTISDGVGECTAALHILVRPFPLRWRILPEVMETYEGDTLEFEIAGFSDEEGADLLIFAHPHEFPLRAAIFRNGNGRMIFRWFTRIGDAGFHRARFELTDGRRRIDGLTLITVHPALRVSEQNVSIPDEVLLSPFPNPFNSTTCIRFGLPTPGVVELSVCNLSGQDLSRLANGRFQAGYHEIVWEADGLPAGIYLIKIQYERETITRQVTLIK